MLQSQCDYLYRNKIKLHFSLVYIILRSLNDSLTFKGWTTAMSVMEKKKLSVNPRGNNPYQQAGEFSSRHQIGQQIKPPQIRAWAEFQLPRRYAGRVAALQQLAEPIASPRKTKTTQTLSLIYRE